MLIPDKAAQSPAPQSAVMYDRFLKWLSCSVVLGLLLTAAIVGLAYVPIPTPVRIALWIVVAVGFIACFGSFLVAFGYLLRHVRTTTLEHALGHSTWRPSRAAILMFSAAMLLLALVQTFNLWRH